MKKFPLFIILATLTIIIGGVFLSTRSQNSSATISDFSLPASTHVYFWSETCPHCSNVAEFIDGWDKKDIFELEKIEINDSDENSKKFLDAGKFCGIARNNLGVPLLITTKGECLVGDVPIIDYLENVEI